MGFSVEMAGVSDPTLPFRVSGESLSMGGVRTRGEVEAIAEGPASSLDRCRVGGHLIGLPRPSRGCRLGPPAAGSTMPRPLRRGTGRRERGYIRGYIARGTRVSPEESGARGPIANPPSSVRLRPEPLRHHPCEVPVLPGFAGVFAFLGPAAPKSRQPAKLPQSATPSPFGPGQHLANSLDRSRHIEQARPGVDVHREHRGRVPRCRMRRLKARGKSHG